MPTSTHKPPFPVPTIDISPYLASPNSPAAAKIIAEVRTACTITVFFQIVGHGIPIHLQQGIFAAARNYFALPLEEKMKLDSKKTVGHRGYDVLASQSYEQRVEPDLKEGYYIGTDVTPTNPLHGRFFMGSNIWPPTSLIPTSAFQTPCEEYYTTISELALRVLDGSTTVPGVNGACP